MSRPFITRLKRDSQYEHSAWVERTDQPVCKSGLLMWSLVTEDQLRCFVRRNQNQEPTFKSSRVAIKSWNTLQQIDSILMRMCIFEFFTSICANVWLV